MSDDQGTPEQSTRLSILNDQWGVARWSLNDDDPPVLDVVLDDGSVIAVEADGEWHYR